MKFKTLVADVQELTSTRQFQKLVGKLDAADSSLRSSPKDCMQALNDFDVGVHSLGWLYFLAPVVGSRDRDTGDSLRLLNTFFRGCNAEQMHFAHDKCLKLAQTFLSLASSAGQGSAAALALARAVTIIQQNRGILTPLHVNFLKLCMTSKAYHAAVPVLERSVVEVGIPVGNSEVSSSSSNNNKGSSSGDPNTTIAGVSALDVMRYFYYGGIVYLSLKRFAEARTMLQTCISLPTESLSAVIVEAYKKLVLCSLLLNGSMPEVPKYASPVIYRHVEDAADLYVAFGKAFERAVRGEERKPGAVPSPSSAAMMAAASEDPTSSSSPMSEGISLRGRRAGERGGEKMHAKGHKKRASALHELMDVQQSTFTADHNWGLVKQCRKRVVQLRIRRLMDTYVGITFQQVSERAGLEKSSLVLAAAEEFKSVGGKGGDTTTVTTETWLLQMIREGSLAARIDQVKQMMEFTAAEGRGGAKMVQQLQQEVVTALELAQRLQDADKDLSLSDLYLRKVVAREAKGAAPSSDVAMGVGLSVTELGEAGEWAGAGSMVGL